MFPVYFLDFDSRMVFRLSDFAVVFSLMMSHGPSKETRRAMCDSGIKWECAFHIHLVLANYSCFLSLMVYYMVLQCEAFMPQTQNCHKDL